MRETLAASLLVYLVWIVAAIVCASRSLRSKSRRLFMAGVFSLTTLAVGDATAGRLRLFGHIVDPNAFSMGTATRQGYGGRPVNETANTDLTGTWGAYFKVDDQRMIVPAASGAYTYGAAWTPPPGQTSVQVVGGSGTTYTIYLPVGAAHTRERFSTGGVNQDGVVQDGATCQLFRHLWNASWIDLGKTIWCRDGTLNPTGAFSAYRTDPINAATRSGSGRITIRSETVDNSVDEFGYKNRMHGFKIGRMYWEPRALTELPLAIDWVDVSWYFDGGPIGQMYLFGCNNASHWNDMTFTNTGWKYGPTVTDYSDNGALGPVHAYTTIDQATFRHLGICITTVGVATLDVDSPSHDITVKNVIVRDLRDGDFIDAGGNTWGYTVEDIVMFDCGPLNGGHVDLFQTQWFGVAGWTTPKYFFGTFRRIILAGGNGQSLAQGLFMGDIDRAQFTGITVENCLFTAGGQQLTVTGCNDASVSCVNCISNESSATVGEFLVVGGAGATVRRNLANALSYGPVVGPPLVPAQTGVVATPSPQQTLAHTTVATQAIFPNYVDTITDFSLANLKRMWTPSVAGYAAVQQSTALDPTGAWNPTS